MPKYTNNLGLRMPLENEFFNINMWNTNMKLLDDAYALLKDETGSHTIPASAVSFNNTGTGFHGTNVQAVLNELVQSTILSSYVEAYVEEDITVTVAANMHTWVVLTFGETVYEVAFEMSDGSYVDWNTGKPTFSPNSTYELSFLKGNCKWFKR